MPENTEKASPSPAQAAGSGTEQKVTKSADTARVNALVDKAVKAVQSSQQREKAYAMKIRALERQIAGLKAKDVPPKDDVESEGGEKHNPTDDEEDNFPSKDAATTPAHATTSTGGAFTGKSQEDFDKAVNDAVAKQLAASIPEIVKKVRTPTPYGYVDEKGNVLSIPQMVQKAIDFDRKACGGAYQTEESFGFRTGATDMVAKEKSLKYLHKMFNGEEDN